MRNELYEYNQNKMYEILILLIKIFSRKDNFVRTWINLEDKMLSKLNWKKRTNIIYCRFYVESTKVKLTKTNFNGS